MDTPSAEEFRGYLDHVDGVCYNEEEGEDDKPVCEHHEGEVAEGLAEVARWLLENGMVNRTPVSLLDVISDALSGDKQEAICAAWRAYERAAEEQGNATEA